MFRRDEALSRYTPLQEAHSWHCFLRALTSKGSSCLQPAGSSRWLSSATSLNRSASISYPSRQALRGQSGQSGQARPGLKQDPSGCSSEVGRGGRQRLAASERSERACLGAAGACVGQGWGWLRGWARAPAVGLERARAVYTAEGLRKGCVLLGAARPRQAPQPQKRSTPLTARAQATTESIARGPV